MLRDGVAPRRGHRVMKMGFGDFFLCFSKKKSDSFPSYQEEHPFAPENMKNAENDLEGKKIARDAPEQSYHEWPLVRVLPGRLRVGGRRRG